MIYENLPSTNTPLNATNLNKFEQNIGTYGADTYSASSTYAVGDIVTHGGLLYECNTAISTAEAWNSSHWTQKSTLAKINEHTNMLKTTVKRSRETGTIAVGATKYSGYINGFVGLASIRVYTENFEYYRIMAIGGANKYYHINQNLLSGNSTGNPNASCNVFIYESPDTINYQVAIANTGSVSLNYIITLINLIN